MPLPCERRLVNFMGDHLLQAPLLLPSTVQPCHINMDLHYYYDYYHITVIVVIVSMPGK